MGGWLDLVKLRLAKASQLSWCWGLAWLSLAKVQKGGEGSAPEIKKVGQVELYVTNQTLASLLLNINLVVFTYII